MTADTHAADTALARQAVAFLASEIAAHHALHPEALECDTVMWLNRFPRLCALIEAEGCANGWLSVDSPRHSFRDAMGHRMKLLPEALR